MGDEHPSAFRLEAFHAGEPDAATGEHVSTCAACRAYVDGLGDLKVQFGARNDASAFLARIAATAAAESPTQAPAVRPARPWRAPVFVALAAAAALAVVVLRGPSSPPPSPALSADTPDRLKGAPNLAAIVLRDGTQHRATGTVTVRAGDRLRFEISTGEAGPLRVEVIDRTTTPGSRRLLFEGERPAGLTLTPEALAVDTGPTDAWIIAGPPAAVAATNDPGDPGAPVARLRLVGAP